MAGAILSFRSFSIILSASTYPRKYEIYLNHYFQVKLISIQMMILSTSTWHPYVCNHEILIKIQWSDITDLTFTETLHSEPNPCLPKKSSEQQKRSEFGIFSFLMSASAYFLVSHLQPARLLLSFKGDKTVAFGNTGAVLGSKDIQIYSLKHYSNIYQNENWIKQNSNIYINRKKI